MNGEMIRHAGLTLQEAVPLINQTIHAALPLARQALHEAQTAAQTPWLQDTAETLLQYPLINVALGSASALVDTIVDDVYNRNAIQQALEADRIDQDRYDALIAERTAGRFLGELATKATTESLAIYAGSAAIDFGVQNPLGLSDIAAFTAKLGGIMFAIGGACPDCLHPLLQNIIRSIFRTRTVSSSAL